jgi:NAD(P)-dependent dehydrogenase (short-subunit alcohol dehydrogenase family)
LLSGKAVTFDRASVALVTGAASGIGDATVRRLIAHGVGGVALVDRDRESLARVAMALPLPPARVLQRVHDVADEHAWVETACEVQTRFGRLDYAVANAGVSDAGTIAEFPFDRWRKVMSVNLDGVFLTLKASMPLIKAGGRGGAIVVVSSVSGVKAEPGVGAYGASKAAAVQLAKVAAKEGAPDRIRVNAILPGGVETPIWREMPFFQDLIAQHGSEAAAFAAMAKMATPLGRYANADEIAGQIAHLLSDDSALMTGAALVIDGGYSL